MVDTIEQYINRFPDEIESILRELRSVIKTAMPEACETIYHDALSYSLSPSVFERLVFLATYKNYFGLGFNFGGYLPDPDHLLVGEGKRLRHVKVRSLVEAKQPAIRQLVQAAWTCSENQVEIMKKELYTKSTKSRG